MKKKLALLLALLVLFGNLGISSVVSAAEVSGGGSNANPFARMDQLRLESQKILGQDSSLGADQPDGGKAAAVQAEKSGRAADKKADKDAGRTYLVTFKTEASLQQIYDILQDEEYELVGASENRVILLTTANIGAFRAKAGSLVRSAEKNQARQVEKTANDSYYSRQWALPAIGAPAAWDITTGTAAGTTNPVFVAVIDSGIDRQHLDLDDADIRNGWDFITGDNVYWDSIGHGTNVTGIIAAETNNSQGIAGVCWNISIIPLRVVYSDGSIYTDDICDAIYTAADVGCKVINLSLGGGYSSAEDAAIQYAYDKGCIVIASSGNSGNSNVYYPASYSHVVSVGSINSSGNYSSFSTYNNYVDVCAPGESVISTNDNSFSPYSDYASVSGTSFSSPYVAGVAALAVCRKRDLTPDQFMNLLKYTSQDKGTAGYDPHYGYGLVRANTLLANLGGSSNDYLSRLTFSSGTLSPAFASSQSSYNLRLPASASSVNISTIKAQANARVYIDGVLCNSRTITAPSQGSYQQVTVTVVSQNLANQRNYVIQMYRPYDSFNLSVYNSELNFDGYMITGTVDNYTNYLYLDYSVDNNATAALYSDASCTVPLEGSYLDLAEGVNRFYLKAMAEDPTNTFVYPIIIRRNYADASPFAPTLIVQNDVTRQTVAAGGYARTAVRATVIGENTPICTALRNGQPYSWPAAAVFTEAGYYQLSVVDSNNLTAAADFTIDLTKPAVTVRANGAYLSSGVYTRFNPVISASDANLKTKTLKLNGTIIAWPSNNTLTSSGTYTISAADLAGNSSTFYLTIDKTAPVIIVKTPSGATVYTTRTATDNAVVTVTETNLQSKAVKKNGVSMTWPSNNTFTADGTYSLTVTDKAGNTVSRTVTVCKTKPVFYATNTKPAVVGNNGFSGSNTTVSVTGYQLKSRKVTRNGYAMTWPSGNLFTTAAKYVVTGELATGVKATFTFTIDKTYPAVTVKTSGGTTLTSGAVTRSNVAVTASDTYLASRTVKKNNTAISWPSGNLFTLEGAYVVTAVDKAGNTRTASFTIDRTRPVITAKTTGGANVANGGYAKADTVITISDLSAASKTIKKNGAAISWPSGNKLTADGVYAISVTDKIGLTSTFSLTVDKTMPTLRLTANSTTLVNYAHTRYAVTLSVADNNLKTKTIKRNGSVITWPSTNTLSTEGFYSIYVTDKAGNMATSYVTIDKTLPVITARTQSGSAVANGGTARQQTILTVTETNVASKVLKKDNVTISWPTGSLLTQEGQYVLTVTDKAGNTASFSLKLDLPPVIQVTTASSAGVPIANGAMVNEDAGIAVNELYLTDKSLTRDSIAIDWPSDNTVVSSGTYVVTASDAAGNTSTFTFTIDRFKPAVSVEAEGGTPLTSGAVVNTSVQIVSVTDTNLLSSTLTKNGVPLSEPWPALLTENGLYVITAADKAGNTTTFTFTIDKTPPVITGFLDDSSQLDPAGPAVASDVRIFVEENNLDSRAATLNGVPIDWPELDTFTANGAYVITVTDLAGNESTLSFTIAR